ncbi:hypothetical protein HFV08_02970 [Streptomyces sp. LD120]|uniref:Uncharacterized protein n=1 Tax=Streptomyces physcomitrii TaxID=2724184 RepID=A0ABX1GYL7_9ACTN|nr:hypothetical protein [Streptomyces physcomitrii]
MPYVRGWSAARQSTDALAEQLMALGLSADFPALKAGVNVRGDGIVRLGAIRPDAASLLALLLTAGLTVEMARNENRPGGDDGASTDAA